MTRRPGQGNGRVGASASRLLFRVDHRAGPARRLPSAVAAALVRSAIEEALEGPEELDPALVEPIEPPRGIGRVLADAAAALLGVSGERMF